MFELLYQKVRHFLLPRNSRREMLARLVQRVLTNLSSHISPAYPNWIKLNEPDQFGLIAQQKLVASLPIQPLITIIIPVGTQSSYLRAITNSILAQNYSNWEVQFVGNKNLSDELIEDIKKLADSDSRIILKFVSAARPGSGYNQLLETSVGEFVLLMSKPLNLSPYALSSVVLAINDCPEVDLLYSDEDQLGTDLEKRSEPFFRPGFSIDYLRAYPYIDHMLVLRKKLGDKLGWLQDGFEDAWLYDLVFRAVEQSRWISHIPEILVHIHPSIAAETSRFGSSVSEAAEKAVKNHLIRSNLGGAVEPGLAPGLNKIRYPLDSTPLISIIIPNHDHFHDLERCVNSILALTRYQMYEIVIIENNSQSKEIFELYEQLQQRDKRIRVINYTQKPFNFSQINNFAVEKAQGEILLFLNNDTQVLEPDWLEGLLEYALRPDVGAVGAKLYFNNWLIQHAGVIIGLGLCAGHHSVGTPRDFPGYHFNLLVPQNYSAVTAACMMLRRDLFLKVGGFDDQFSLSYGDIDLCLKIQHAGYQITWTPYVELMHYESSTRGYEITPLKEARYKGEALLFSDKWSDILASGDPFYNPNLSLTRGDFAIRRETCFHRARHSKGPGYRHSV